MSKIICVVPTIRPDRMEDFERKWAYLFEKHGVKLVKVWDGDVPMIEDPEENKFPASSILRDKIDEEIFCNRTDACRNYGFLWAAKYAPDATHIITLDDDCYPLLMGDAIQEHLNVLGQKVPTSWMNTAQNPQLLGYWMRGFPAWAKTESEVAVSHGVWYNVPDFDGTTQKKLTEEGMLPKMLDYYRGPVPAGVQMPVCGMNLMFSREMLPWVYFFPMGPKSGIEGLNRFADIWMGIRLKTKLDGIGKALFTGASVIEHSRASDCEVNIVQEKLGKTWNEWYSRSNIGDIPAEDRGTENYALWMKYRGRAYILAERYRALISREMVESTVPPKV